MTKKNIEHQTSGLQCVHTYIHHTYIHLRMKLQYDLYMGKEAQENQNTKVCNSKVKKQVVRPVHPKRSY